MRVRRSLRPRLRAPVWGLCATPLPAPTTTSAAGRVWAAAECRDRFCMLLHVERVGEQRCCLALTHTCMRVAAAAGALLHTQASDGGHKWTEEEDRLLTYWQVRRRAPPVCCDGGWVLFLFFPAELYFLGLN